MDEKITEKDIDKSLALLQSLNDDPYLLASLPEAKRVALAKAAGLFSRPDRNEIRLRHKAVVKTQRKILVKKDRGARASTGIREARNAQVFQAPQKMLQGATENILETPRHCYICKSEFIHLHSFYDSMCLNCADFNYQKRFQTTSLVGQTALITGSRLKIGYQASLMMLRAGARVIATTRFPVDAAQRFSQEKDFGDWKNRLQVYGLDLRHTPSVEIFCRYIDQNESRLDILINNAAQTVRRPPGFYSHLLAGEEKAFEDLSPEVQNLLQSWHTCTVQINSINHPETSTVESLKGSTQALHETSPSTLPKTSPKALIETSIEKTITKIDSKQLVQWHRQDTAMGLRSSARLSQIPYTHDHSLVSNEIFPAGKLDADLQQVDLRKVNSWRLRLADVPTAELLEVQLVNAIAPFVLCSQLAPLMRRDNTGQKHIVNVTAMEGKFARYTKTDYHPHTNMAKASLNMLTHTSAKDLAKDGIFMNAVDTGWVTDEDPITHSVQKQEMHDFFPPLDIVDGAARVCDPFFDGIITGTHWSGKFLKDYKPTDW